LTKFKLHHRYRFLGRPNNIDWPQYSKDEVFSVIEITPGVDVEDRAYLLRFDRSGIGWKGNSFQPDQTKRYWNIWPDEDGFDLTEVEEYPTAIIRGNELCLDDT